MDPDSPWAQKCRVTVAALAGLDLGAPDSGCPQPCPSTSHPWTYWTPLSGPSLSVTCRRCAHARCPPKSPPHPLTSPGPGLESVLCPGCSPQQSLRFGSSCPPAASCLLPTCSRLLQCSSSPQVAVVHLPQGLCTCSSPFLGSFSTGTNEIHCFTLHSFL